MSVVRILAVGALLVGCTTAPDSSTSSQVSQSSYSA
jgi:hypothetical protein